VWFSAAIGLLFTGAITGRNQLDLVPVSTLNSLGAQSYNEFISEHKYCSQNNLSDRIKGYKWEFNLVEDPSVNAFFCPAER